MYDGEGNKPELAVLVLSFDMCITRPQLDALMKYGRDGQEWGHWSVPVIARDRLWRAINEALIAMSDEYGRIIHDETIWREAGDEW